MTADDIAAQTESYIRQRFSVSEADPDFTRDVHLFDYGYIDSFGAVELTTHLETTFDIEIDPQDFLLHAMNTVNEIAAFVRGRAAGEI